MSSDAFDSSYNYGPPNPYDVYVATNSVAKLSTIPQKRMYSTPDYSPPVVNNIAFSLSNLNVNATPYSTSYTTTNKSVSFKMKSFK
jgi:hypothetical protein